MMNYHDCPLLEGVITTQNEDGSLHIAAMGPRVDWPITRMLLRPFKSAVTFHNLCRTRRGILHVTDDVLLLARAAIGRLPEQPATEPGPEGYPPRLADCVRWYAFEVETIDDSQERSKMECRVTDEGRVRDFFGLHRARGAVIEAAILASRLSLIPMEDVLDRYNEYGMIIDKTAGPDERMAFAELQGFVNERMAEGETRTMFDS
ncbi:DUF447 domain-containing protein [Aeoliella mucimassa]|uniref:DUF447 family protein n=1 Tax=Aeoliella mucimassa TaxID=2527972 RepID=A0A518AK89_9BACT|nr:DUF447 domain-containing protein [Aeoliella mucimassa]QDU55133.1 hypothetical protein Pan181_13190 [Aeoliella mucimassa]